MNTSVPSPAARAVHITLPDDSVRSFDAPVSGADIAAAIGPGLAKAALAVAVDGALWDLDRPIEADSKVAIVTRKDEAALELIRHDAAHILAMAVQELFPGTQVTIGPTIEDGFYYDFARDEPFHPADLEAIEARMREIVARDEPTRREIWDRDAAITHFRAMGEFFKAELIEAIPQGDDVTIYHHGPWHDLCRGPHLRSTGKIGTAFKLTKIAGAYWRGDAKNAQLQRIYGTAWRDDKELQAYLTRVEEAEKRDHRKLGREMDLFHIQEEAKGMIFWHPKGWTLYRTLVAYMRRRIEAAGYVEVKTPQIMDRSLWERSGHWEKFRKNMFVAETDEGEVLAIKPMNCPGHIQIFNQGLKSYRDLPIRMAEFEGLHRCEASGALHGLMRVQQMAQDDAHIFCRDDQIEDETRDFVVLLNSVYKDLAVELDSVKLALRPELRAGSDEVWDIAEAKLERAAKAAGVEVEKLPDEGAFYGPKLEFHLRDAIGRTWQCGTLQLDFVLPERLGAEYVGEDGKKHRPVMLHRAIFGSIERFVGVLIEHHAGRFPLWLAPVQIVVATITSDADAYAEQVAETLTGAGLRVGVDLRNEKINYKVREHSLAKVPVLLVVGRREADNATLSVRRLGSDRQQSLTLAEAVQILKDEACPPDLRAIT